MVVALAGRKGKCCPRSNNRRFFDALLGMARSGARWRDPPERFGPYQTVKRRTGVPAPASPQVSAHLRQGPA